MDAADAKSDDASSTYFPVEFNGKSISRMTMVDHEVSSINGFASANNAIQVYPSPCVIGFAPCSRSSFMVLKPLPGLTLETMP